MRHKKPSTVKNEVTIKRRITRGVNDLPPFVDLGHRHLEKEAIATPNTKSGRFVVPLDLARMVLPKELTDSIESIELIYKKG